MAEPAIDYEKIFEDNIESAIEKHNSGRISDLSEEEKSALDYYKKNYAQQQARGQIPEELLVPEAQRGLVEFNKRTQKHIEKGGKRIIHITDTESSPEDLEKIIDDNLRTSGGFINEKGEVRLQRNDILIHTGDMLEDFIDFKRFHHGTQGFLTKRIIEEGGLNSDEAKEFSDVYSKLLKKHGVVEHQLLEGQLTKQLVEGLQGLYFGQTPGFMNQTERKDYKEKFAKFKKHLKTAIKNDAKRKYSGYKDIFDKYELTPEDLVLIEGNHDVPDVMREVLGAYMPNPGTVVERKGLRFGNPLSGSTGAHLGPEFVDTFGYTDIREQLETIKYGTPAFQGLLDKMKGYDINHIDEKDLSQLILMSQARASQGIGHGDLAHYFNERVKPQIDQKVDEMRGKILKDVPKDVDFYLFHGQPNHSTHAGLEEAAAFAVIDKKGGNIIHGHEHSKTTHRMGKSLLLNQGDGTHNFGVYHVENKNGENDITDIFSQTHNKTFGSLEYGLTNKNKIRPQDTAKDYS